MVNKTTLCYKDAGVNIDAGNEFVNRIKPIVKKTKRSEVIGNVGGFGALCNIPTSYKEPVLVASSDGVGTKLRLAIDWGRYESVGIDLVAMCVNDLIVQGAEPLFFLDYYATGQLEVNTASSVITGIAEGCLQSGCALIGGETAEMPGMYHHKDFDLAGFCVGIVEKADIIDGSQVRVGDAILALGSNGPHANGYSLIRKIINDHKIDIQQQMLDGKPVIDHLLASTKIYVKSLLHLIKEMDIHAAAHITGGGFWENIPRILPDNCQAILNESAWQWPAIFSWLQDKGQIDTYEMYRTFNCGVGMVIVLSHQDALKAIDFLHSNGEKAWLIGEICAANDQNQVMIQS